MNLANYSKDELLLWVMNDEALYSIRHEPFLWEVLDEIYDYTEEQKNVLIEGLEND